MKNILNRLFEHQTLTREEARTVLSQITGGHHNNAQVAAFLTVYLMRAITVEELTGFRDAMLELCLKIDLADFDPMDLCGTGGDGKNTFNISTLSAFVTAAAGVPVAKHGNYGVSSVSGSSNVMEYFGAKFTNDESQLKRQMETAGICFLHAPLFHPAMKHVGPIRRELGVKTFFNMLGPMVNPAFPQKQISGVFNLELARLYYYLFQATGKRFTIVHSLDGYDEMSLTGPCKTLLNEGEYVLHPEDLNLHTWTPEDLFGGDTVEDAALIFRQILEGTGTQAQQEAVIANSALAIRCAQPELTLTQAAETARETLVSGKALLTFKTYLELA